MLIRNRLTKTFSIKHLDNFDNTTNEGDTIS